MRRLCFPLKASELCNFTVYRVCRSKRDWGPAKRDFYLVGTLAPFIAGSWFSRSGYLSQIDGRKVQLPFIPGSRPSAQDATGHQPVTGRLYVIPSIRDSCPDSRDGILDWRGNWKLRPSKLIGANRKRICQMSNIIVGYTRSMARANA